MLLRAMDSHQSKGAVATPEPRDSYVKKTWEEAVEGDDAVASTSSATKKRRFAAGQSSRYDSDAMGAQESVLAHPTGAPPGLFDFHTEAQKIRQSSPKDAKKLLQALKERAKTTKFLYQDRETLLLAVELYNCSNKVYVRQQAHATRRDTWRLQLGSTDTARLTSSIMVPLSSFQIPKASLQ
jgi:hypothetical protein